ncbi:lantibiotic dehydratase [Streptomyces griseocarneus]|uniref:lantibiotic dehydratase n=1 Tax=Streptomyces griseocarneus TaxID=51201 RepID=UPI00167E500B|nr:lantibiotic dehydratase [Streptomyces griseocarneus]MBZ6477596.1 lantibiotic dehydratase [Streptomyces griseocarneus]GHG83405.1 lantibiotic dehydratase [Streptomyces griseocarneus]
MNSSGEAVRAGDGIPDVDFESAGVALLRAAILPLTQGGTPPTDSPHAADRLLAQLTADQRLMAAVELASPSLAEAARKAVAGEPLRPKALRRTVAALAKYHLRMVHRPTPFGLFAGVALAGFGAETRLGMGAGHRTVTRPDAAWLDGVLESLLDVPEVRERCLLVANNLHTVRDGRLVLVDHHDGTGAKRLVGSVRLTQVVRHVMTAADGPLPWPRLLEELERRFPQAPEGAIERTVAQLVHGRFLLTDLAPPPDCVTPLDHVCARLESIDHPVAYELHGIREDLRALDRVPPDTEPATRRERSAAVTGRMRALRPADDVVQTDVALTAHPVLPQEVAREAERAATVLWRTAPVLDGSPYLREYRLAFLERYGTDRPAPLLELLDPARGLGLPGGYHDPAGPPPGSGPADDGARDRLLGELLLEAVRHGSGEVVLDEETIRGLGAGRRRPAPQSLELGAELVASGPAALRAGDFRLVLGPGGVSPLAGAVFSRFAPVLGRSAAHVGDLALRSGSAPDGQEIRACVAYRPKVARSANVALVPQWLPYRIPLGVGPAAGEGVTDLRVEDLAVYAETDALRLVHVPTGRRVRPLSYSMLNPASGHLPHVARFLLDLGQEGREFCPPWSWGSWSSAPVLPRVRHGRTVLSPARWLPGPALAAAARGTATEAEWVDEAACWRRRWDVPRHVLLARADHRVAVDLEDPLHLNLLRDELRRAPGTAVVERLDGGGSWLHGPDGPHAAELFLPVFAKPAAPPRTAPPRTAPPRPSVPPRAAAGRAPAHLPGGEWLHAKLYVPEELQPAVLARHLGALTEDALLREAGADLWFFLRYDDHAGPHLRLRFHGKPEPLWRVLVPALRAWAHDRRDAGLLSGLVLDGYEPEVERYGGPAAIGRAERVFHADSAAVLSALSATGRPVRQEAHAAAPGIIAVLTALGGEDEALEWLGTDAVLARRGDVPRAWKEAAADASAAATGYEDARAGALSALREVLPDDRERVRGIALSLAHMHCNRLLGPGSERELLAHVTAREALALRAGRRRHRR